jgi:hypothetical protein
VNSLRLMELVGEHRPDPAIEFLRRARGTALDGSGIPASEIAGKPIPAPLRRLYEFCGRWPGLSGQNRLLSPEQLYEHDGRLVFYEENQGVFVSAFDLGEDDPNVWSCDEDPFKAGPRRWRPDAGPLSWFLLQARLLEYVFAAPVAASRPFEPLDAQTAHALLSRLKALPGPAFTPHQMRHYVSDDAVVQVDPAGFAMIGAASCNALEALELDDLWETSINESAT